MTSVGEFLCDDYLSSDLASLMFIGVIFWPFLPRYESGELVSLADRATAALFGYEIWF